MSVVRKPKPMPTVQKSPGNVKNIVNKFVREDLSPIRSREASPQESGLVKSRSFNDIHMVEGDWELLNREPQSPELGKPPRPPARRKRSPRLEGNSSDTGRPSSSNLDDSPQTFPFGGTYYGKKTPVIKQSSYDATTPSPSSNEKRSPKLPRKVPYPGTQQQLQQPVPPPRPANNKLPPPASSKIPPRPPPPFTKPTQRSVRKTLKSESSADSPEEKRKMVVIKTESTNSGESESPGECY